MSSGRPRTLVRLMSSLIVVLSGCGAEPSKKPDEAASRRQVAAKKVLVAWQEPAPNGTVRPILELEAESGTLQEDRGSGSFQRTRSKVYRKGVLIAELRAPAIDAEMGARRIIASGGVHIIGHQPSGLQMDADRLEWLLNEDRIIALGRVRFVQRDRERGTLIAEGGLFDRITMYTQRQRITIP